MASNVFFQKTIVRHNIYPVIFADAYIAFPIVALTII